MRNTLKKTFKMLTVLSLSAALLVGGSVSAMAAGGTISKTKAKQTALKRAGVSSSSVKKWIRVALDDYDDDGDRDWDVEFQTSSYRYDVEVDGRTGKVEDIDRERLPSKSSKYIGVDKAKSIALSHAKKNIGISGSVRYIKSKLDHDDGIYVYDIEFINRGMEFEYEIDARSGRIRDWDADYDD